MAVILENSVILHIPKTAGKYVRAVLDINEIPYHQTSRNTPCQGMGKELSGYRSSHCIPRADDEYKSRENRLVFVRHPLTWYLSYWAFRMRFKNTDQRWMYWRLDSRFDQMCGDDDFNRFIDKVITEWPHGFLTALYAHYTNEVSMVGLMERVDGWLLDFLYMHEGVEKLKLPGAKVNISDHRGAKYTRGQAEAIMDVESVVVSKYGYDYIPKGVV
jgi:hypothetical protein